MEDKSSQYIKVHNVNEIESANLHNDFLCGIGEFPLTISPHWSPSQEPSSRSDNSIALAIRIPHTLVGLVEYIIIGYIRIRSISYTDRVWTTHIKKF